MKWKPDWPRAKQNLIRWWNRQDLALCLKAPRPEALSSAAPSAPEDPTAYWTGPAYRLAKAEHEMATTWYAAEAFPCFDTQIGPGSLGTFLGARPRFTHRTVWYEPCIDDPDRYPDIRFDPTHPWFTAHMALIERGIAATDGRYLVGIPDLIENADTLAALRGSEDLLADLIDRPQWVIRRIDQINQAFFEAFDRMYHVVKDEQGGQVYGCFYLWGPGRTAKTQCDVSCMISPAMFRRFVVPALRAQCDWLDFALYHLDGADAVKHLDALFEIDSLHAIQWVPGPGQPNCGHEHWHELFRRIKAAGKGVQVACSVEQVIPLLDAIGPEGTFVVCTASNMDEGQALLERVEAYRTVRHETMKQRRERSDMHDTP